MNGKPKVLDNTAGLIPVWKEDNAEADIVFIHGIGALGQSNWAYENDPIYFWPAWIAEDLPRFSVWTLGYATSKSNWTQESMPIGNVGDLVLERMAVAGVGERPLVVIAHSMGGIVLKYALQVAEAENDVKWKRIANSLRAVVFISTPHRGAGVASFASFVKLIYNTSEQLEELSAHEPRLGRLHRWFRNYQARQGFLCLSLCETRKYVHRFWSFGVKFGTGILVVPPSSACSELPGDLCLPLDEDHLSICRPRARNSPLYEVILSRVFPDHGLPPRLKTEMEVECIKPVAEDSDSRIGGHPGTSVGGSSKGAGLTELRLLEIDNLISDLTAMEMRREFYSSLETDDAKARICRRLLDKLEQSEAIRERIPDFDFIKASCRGELR